MRHPGEGWNLFPTMSEKNSCQIHIRILTALEKFKRSSKILDAPFGLTFHLSLDATKPYVQIKSFSQIDSLSPRHPLQNKVELGQIFLVRGQIDFGSQSCAGSLRSLIATPLFPALGADAL